MIGVNLTGVYYCCREAIGGMLDKGGGRIVNVASVAGLTGPATSPPIARPSTASSG